MLLSCWGLSHIYVPANLLMAFLCHNSDFSQGCQLSQSPPAFFRGHRRLLDAPAYHSALRLRPDPSCGHLQAKVPLLSHSIQADLWFYFPFSLLDLVQDGGSVLRKFSRTQKLLSSSYPSLYFSPPPAGQTLSPFWGRKYHLFLSSSSFLCFMQRFSDLYYV